MAPSENPEDEYSAKLDLCITDGIVKTGSGAILGALSAALFFRRRWPIIAGAGIGIGMAWANCEYSLKGTQRSRL